jgi:hypothetical protein
MKISLMVCGFSMLYFVITFIFAIELIFQQEVLGIVFGILAASFAYLSIISGADVFYESQNKRRNHETRSGKAHRNMG